MKKSFFISAFALIAFFIISCSKEKDVHNNVNEVNQKKIETILNQIKSLGDSQGKIVVFKLENASKKDYQEYFEIIENSKDVLEFTLGFDSKLQEDKQATMTVTCTWGNGETEETVCTNLACAGQATWDCLENGGCATVCNTRIVYIPSKIKPSQNNKLKSIESILQKVEEIGETKNEIISFSIAFDKNEKYWLNDISTTIEYDSNRLPSGGSYQVDCYGSDGELAWQENYPDTLSASQGILDCTDAGGCAEICEIYARYIPKK